MRRPAVLVASLLALAACRGGEPKQQQATPPPASAEPAATAPAQPAPAAPAVPRPAPAGTLTASDGSAREVASLWEPGCAILSFYRGKY